MMRSFRDDLGKIILLILVLVSTVATFTIPIMEHLRTKRSMDTTNNNTNENGELKNINEMRLENNFSSPSEFLSGVEERRSSDWSIPEYLEKLENILPSTSLFPSTQPEETGNQIAPKNSSTSFSSSILSRLFPNIIIGRPSVFRVQFYNSDFEDRSSPDEDNSTGPNAVFGSPLCLGLCVPIQVFSENTSIHFLSDKQISLLPPAPDPTPLFTATEDSNSKLNHLDQQELLNINSSSTAIPSSDTDQDGTFGWLSSWIPSASSLSKIQSSIQLPDLFPQLSTTVLDFVG